MGRQQGRRTQINSTGSRGRDSADDSRLREAVKEVRSIYEELSKRPAERNCVSRTECCRFRLTGRMPQLTRGEALVVAAGWRAAGRKNLPPESANADGACPFLGSEGRCQVYRDRPFGCRTHFCEAAGGVRDRSELIDLIRRLEVIDEALGGEGPRSLQKAVEDVWNLVPGRRKRGR